MPIVITSTRRMPVRRTMSLPPARPASTYIHGMQGLGDNIFQRAFLKTMTAKQVVYLSTSWPELYQDLNVRCVRAVTSLRTQSKNIDRQHVRRWAIPPSTRPQIQVRYGHDSLARGNIVQSMQECFGVPPGSWDLPAFPRMERSRPIALVRPVTVRKEWTNTARNPLPEYVAAVADDLYKDYHVVSVADLSDAHEWVEGTPPPAHEYFHRGELDVSALLGLVQSAAVIVGGVGWIVPASIAARVPLFCILGGHGAHNAPEKITDPRMDLTHAHFARPDRFCGCSNMRHACDKRNSRLESQWRRFRSDQSV